MAKAKKKKDTRGGVREGAGRKGVDKMDKKYPITIYLELKYINNIGELMPSQMAEILANAVSKERDKLIKKEIL